MLPQEICIFRFHQFQWNLVHLQRAEREVDASQAAVCRLDRDAILKFVLDREIPLLGVTRKVFVTEVRACSASQENLLKAWIAAGGGLEAAR